MSGNNKVVGSIVKGILCLVSSKLNMFTPSTHIKIIDEKYMMNNQPDYALILSWHYGKNVMKNLRNKGYKGKFIMPLPKPRIIN